MKYTVTISGRGGEISIGTLHKDTFEYFQQNSLLDYMLGEANAPKHISDDLPRDNPCSDIDGIFGPFVSSRTYATVKDSNDVDIFKGLLGEDWDSDDPIYELPTEQIEFLDIHKLEQDYVFFALDVLQGVFHDYEFETDEFDPEKFNFTYKQYGDEYDNYHAVVIDVYYAGEKLKPIAYHHTRGKSTEYRLYDIKNNELISTNDE